MKDLGQAITSTGSAHVRGEGPSPLEGQPSPQQRRAAPSGFTALWTGLEETLLDLKKLVVAVELTLNVIFVEPVTGLGLLQLLDHRRVNGSAGPPSACESCRVIAPRAGAGFGTSPTAANRRESSVRHRSPVASRTRRSQGESRP